RRACTVGGVFYDECVLGVKKRSSNAVVLAELGLHALVHELVLHLRVDERTHPERVSQTTARTRTHAHARTDQMQRRPAGGTCSQSGRRVTSRVWPSVLDSPGVLASLIFSSIGVPVVS